ncbi:hypothetical protein GM556_08470 [Bombella sp. ESL0378]|uniref:hypothetical protein n=1 Tax=Bombella sp. ESL0378 TaxID=2676442 RepID=UPI0012D9BD06|nr:hypothetical protein [Bombella sp. ESL0378]MUG05566.1 hypothetical protein [Bombella sp. ESL0378]
MIGSSRTHDESSESQSAISGNITINAQSQNGSYSRDVEHANKALANKFDAQKLQNQLQASQLGTQLVGQVVGSVFEGIDDARAAAHRRDGDKSAEHTGLFSTEDIARSLIEAGGVAGIAALTGSHVGAAGLGTLVGKLSAMGMRPLAEAAASDLVGRSGVLHDSLAHLMESAAASAGGAVGGLVAGGGRASVNALNGAAAASAIEQYNDQAREKEGKKDNQADQRIVGSTIAGVVDSPVAAVALSGAETGAEAGIITGFGVGDEVTVPVGAVLWGAGRRCCL